MLVVIAAQAWVVFTQAGAWYWPFLDYPMYATARFPGEESHHVEMLAVTEDGVVALHANDFGLAFHTWLYALGYPLAKREAFSFEGLESGQDVARWLQQERPELRLQALRVVDHVYVLERDGLVLSERLEVEYLP